MANNIEPSAITSFPNVDDHLVRPETREELIRGRLVLKPPAEPPHAEHHARLNYVTRGLVAPGYVGSSNLLTRMGPNSDFGTDTSIRRAGIDPSTGSRHLEELVFEVVHEESLDELTERAEELTSRGVRRVIAIFVDQQEVCEWKNGSWVLLDTNVMIEDPTFIRPFPVRALFDKAEADNVVARALRAKKNPEILAMRREGFEEGRKEGIEEGRAQAARKAIEALCEILEIPLDPERRAFLQPLDATKLETLLYAIRKQRRWP